MMTIDTLLAKMRYYNDWLKGKTDGPKPDDVSIMLDETIGILKEIRDKKHGKAHRK